MLALEVFGGFLALTAIVAVVGLVALARPALALLARVDALRKQPVLDVLAKTQARLAVTQRNAAGVPALVVRARAASAKTAFAYEHVAKMVRFAMIFVRGAAIVLGILPNPSRARN